MRRRERAVSKLLELIESPAFPEASRLPAERDLSEQLDLSRSALREGLEVLEAEGRIWRHLGQGTFVGSRPRRVAGTAPLVAPHTSPNELMEARILVEPSLARLAATRATAAEIAELHHLLARSEVARDVETWELWDARLHRAVAEAAHNVLLLSIYEAFNAIRAQPQWSRLRHETLTQERLVIYREEHRAYVDAIAGRDAEAAAQAMRRHLESVRDGLFGNAG